MALFLHLLTLDLPRPSPVSQKKQIHRVSTERTAELNIDQLAKAVKAAVKASVGDIPGLLLWAEDATLNLGWGSEESADVNVSQKFDGGSKTLVILKLQRKGDSAKAKMWFFGAAKVRHEVKGEMFVVQATNDAGLAELSKFNSENATEVLAQMRKRNFFADEGRSSSHASSPPAQAPAQAPASPPVEDQVFFPPDGAFLASANP